MALNTRQLRVRRVRVLGYGVSATALTYLAFCFFTGLFLPPVIMAMLMVLVLGGFVLGCVGFIRIKRLIAKRHMIVRKLYAQRLRIEGRSVVTNDPHPTMLAMCCRSSCRRSCFLSLHSASSPTCFSFNSASPSDHGDSHVGDDQHPAPDHLDVVPPILR
ncbi:hypothetical protein SAMN05421693_10533 [Ectothiorhodospira magna]|uniref:Transmembrane protein n=2 Tax=Ectothiorhodospira magna TaxID=867345 RepID=A0A1H9AEJ9_9GAMM|nr:hypothetical protein SAMN05421693_10533 [Ectothiorhodospira magna]